MLDLLLVSITHRMRWRCLPGRRLDGELLQPLRIRRGQVHAILCPRCPGSNAV